MQLGKEKPSHLGADGHRPWTRRCFEDIVGFRNQTHQLGVGSGGIGGGVWHGRVMARHAMVPEQACRARFDYPNHEPYVKATEAFRKE